ncbi:PD-(D/E)XK nuclease family protein [Roseimaritima sediminicola]|uniref:PD-(D/E)XK nuclease family protein n=1 Tax=Roseimaritima sediminicola TaxID=2662066 RepID=UPI001298513C|nr:PD-(D/E)XK nuclease family protein [Roseimaritima sediminicola]
MPRPNRVFLGWDSPLLPAAATYLRERYQTNGRWDLSGTLLVVPTARAGRRLQSLLRRQAEQHGVSLSLGSILTVGALPERLYEPDAEVALELEQTLAWTQVLVAATPEQLSPLMRNLPPEEPLTPWMELGAALRRLHQTLAADDLRFADVLPHVDTETERRRWQLLDVLLGRYHEQMQAAGRVDPYSARVAAAAGKRCSSDVDIVLIGTTDLNRTLCRMLDQVADRVTALVAAPESQLHLFDTYGSVDPQAWNLQDLPLEDQHLVSADDAPAQVEAMAAQLADFGQAFSPDAITVGVTDESFVSLVETELQLCGVAAHREQGWPLSQTAPGRLLSLLTLLRTRMNWTSLAALLRHADMYDWIDRQLQQLQQEDPLEVEPGRSRTASLPWLSQLDHFLGGHYPTQLENPLPPEAAAAYPVVRRLREIVLRWLRPLDGPPRPLAQWCEALSGLLEEIYPQPPETDPPETDPPVADPPETDPPVADPPVADPPVAATSAETGEPHPAHAEGLLEPPRRLPRTQLAIERIRTMLERFEGLSSALDVEVSAAAAIEMLLGRLAEAPIVLPPRAEMVEILGWLDLALDDAPAMVVVGMNHPFVPESVTADAFLPGSLRSRLNVADNERRYARDAHALHLILSTRPAVRLIVGRRGADGSPTPPSRLLSAASGEDVARRVMMLLDRPPVATPVRHRWSGGATRTELPIPTAGPAKIKVMSVTAFSAYLACPFRFYLRYVLGLRPMDDQAGELQANQFGDLVHGALEEFGKHEEHRMADRADSIRELLFAHLQDYADHHYGDHPAAAVQMQIQQAKRRLSLVAEKQAVRRAEGWEIRFAEAAVNPSDGAAMKVDGKPMGLKGRFDRIDFHPQTGRWAILDYKTHGHKPLKKHIDSATGAWIDLQLPLYRLMTPYLNLDAEVEEVQLGYFNVAEQAEQTGVHLAEFTAEQFAEATKVIEDCIRRIWAGDFTRSSDPVPFDDYAMICQTGLAQTLLDEFAAADEPASPR